MNKSRLLGAVCACVLIFGISASAKADFVKLDWMSTGDELIARDMLTNLEWLNLSVTDNKSINQIAGQYPTTTAINPPAGIYAEFRFATLEEVQELYLNFGIELVHLQPANTIAAYTAFDYLGLTATRTDGAYDFYVQRGAVILGEGLRNSMGVETDHYGTTAVTFVDHTARNFDFTREEVGIFLVRGTHAAPPNGDSDGDGLTDFIEDSNGNGIVDLGETDPQNPDSDYDGLLDGDEDSDGDGVIGVSETNPLDFDSDDDGLTDGYEINIGGTDPNSPTILIPGDMNSDGVVNVADLLLLQRQILGY
jgi:hypothetical protein